MKKSILIFLPLIILFTGCGDRQSEPQVENIIFMIGDGMGLAHVTALSVMQQYAPLNLERAQYVGIQKTYSANNRVTDSAAAGTALACGLKVNNSMLGMAPDSTLLTSSMTVARSLGKSTGIVVSEPVTGATPAAFYARATLRYDTQRIAEQLLESGIDVISGSGRADFNQRNDGRDLIGEFIEKGYSYYDDKAGFLGAGSAPAILLSSSYYMTSLIDDKDGERGDYLAEATGKSLELLEKTGNGFFLMVEGSQIDGFSHANNIAGIVAETRDFDRAVKVAFDYADAHPGTLVVVTADHETGGLCLVSGDANFRLPDAGLNFEFGSTSHTGVFLPIYSYGAGAENFAGVMENTDIAIKMKELLEKGAKRKNPNRPPPSAVCNTQTH